MRRSAPLLASTVGFVVLFAASALSLGTTPDSHDTGPEVAQWLRDNGSHVRWSLWFLTFSLMLFAVFASLVRNRLPTPHRDLFFFGAIALVAETAVQGWILAGLAWHAHALAPATARTVLDVASYWGPVLTSATVLMLAPIALLAFRQEAGLPKWLALVAGVALAEQIIETITIFGRQGFIAPGGPMNLQLGALLTTVAIVSTGIVLALSHPEETAGRVAP
jgi:hypothetical protein